MRIYNLCDVGLNTSSSEGFGLVSFEHAATGAAQVVPGFGNTAELWAGAAELLPAAVTLSHRCQRSRVEERLIDPASVAAALQRLYEDPEHRWRMALAAHRRATDPALDPARLGARWRALFANALRGAKAAEPLSRLQLGDARPL